MAQSVRERLYDAIFAKLQAIKGDSSYNYGLALKSVQDYVLIWGAGEPEGNSFRDTPTIIVRENVEIGNGGDFSVGASTATLTLDVRLVLRGETANGDDIRKGVADLKRAIFANYDGFGSLVTAFRYSVPLYDVERGITTDGVHFVLEVDFNELIGDPTKTGTE